MHLKYLQLLPEDGQTERNEGTKRHIFVPFFTEPTQTVEEWMHGAADSTLQRNRVPVKFSVLPHSTFTVQIVYKLYNLTLKCTYSNYIEAAVTWSAAQQERETVKLMSSEVECSWWFEIVCIYRESYREIRSFKFKLLVERDVSQFLQW